MKNFNSMAALLLPLMVLLLMLPPGWSRSQSLQLLDGGRVVLEWEVRGEQLWFTLVSFLNGLYGFPRSVICPFLAHF